MVFLARSRCVQRPPLPPPPGKAIFPHEKNREKKAGATRACTSPSPAATLPANEPKRPPAEPTAQMGGIIHETRLYPAYHDLQPQSGRGTERPADVGAGPSAVRARQEIHPRNRRPDVGRIRKARRKQK